MTPALVALLAAVAFGCGNLFAWMRGRRRLWLIVGHFVSGVGGAGLLYLALRASALPPDDSSRTAAWAALVLLGCAIVTGLAAPRLRHAGAANLTLTIHMSLGVVAVFIALTLRGRF